MPKINDIVPEWVNPYSVNHSDPTNQSLPENANYYLLENLHHIGTFVEYKAQSGEEIDINELCEAVDYIKGLADLARKNLEAKQEETKTL